MKRGIALLAVAATVLLLSSAVFAQEQPVPKGEFFAGYSWADPNTKINHIPVRNYSSGFGVAGTYDFSKWVGLTVDFGGHYNGNNTGSGRINSSLNTLMVGPKLTFRGEHFAPFLEVLVGVSRFRPSGLEPDHRLAFQAGAGIDLGLSRHWALRVIQADFIGVHHQTDSPTPGTPFKSVFHGARLQGGIVYLVGGGEELPVSASCSVDKSEVWPGEPVKATVTPHNFNPKHTLNVDWTTNGGKVEGKGESVTINTTGSAEGQSYNVSAQVTDPHDKKAVASCQTSFSTRKRLPPTISCSASPASVVQGGSITIHSDASSPQGGPVTVAVTSGCRASGQGADVAVDTSNIQPGSCSVTCTVTDDHQLTASSTTSFSVQEKPKPVQPPPTLVLRSVYFATAQPTPKNPSGGLVKSQQNTLTSVVSEFKKYLAVKPDAKMVLEAHADPRGTEAYNLALTERRAARVKSFLVEQGVPADSIDTHALGEQQQLSADNVKQSMLDDPSLTAGEKKRLLANMRTIVLAANRRVDMEVQAPGVPSQLSERRYPFSAADALSLIGGREKPKVAPPTRPKRGPARKGTQGGTRTKKK
jgi:outer membrane protein OmpA-like peptidoglycan-associated protein